MRSPARTSLTLLASLALGLVAVAQEPTPAAPAEPAPAATPAAAPEDALEDEGDEPGPERQGRVRDPVIVALGLPQAAQAARQAGLSEEEVRDVLRAAKGQGVGAAETTELMRRTAKVAREHGTIDGWSDFVKGELAAGKRGRELAAALKAAHVERGRGPKGGPPRGGPGGGPRGEGGPGPGDGPKLDGAGPHGAQGGPKADGTGPQGGPKADGAGPQGGPKADGTGPQGGPKADGEGPNGPGGPKGQGGGQGKGKAGGAE